MRRNSYQSCRERFVSRQRERECLSQSAFPLVRWLLGLGLRKPVKDVQIRSVSYERRRGRLEPDRVRGARLAKILNEELK